MEHFNALNEGHIYRLIQDLDQIVEINASIESINWMNNSQDLLNALGQENS